MAHIVWNEVAYDRYTKSPTGEVGRYLAQLGLRLSALAKTQVGVDTGQLRRSINYKVARDGRGLGVTVGSNNRIALLHHQGARPHVIYPRRAKVLRFYSRGRIVYAQVVNHPGTRPNRYLTDNLRKVV